LVRDRNRQLAVHLEREAGFHIDRATVAWCFDLDLWGRCGLGEDEPSALAALAREIGVAAWGFQVAERITGDERAFQRDRLPATAAETGRTIAILGQMAWHLADTESRYYLPSLGERPLPRGGELLAELDASHRHVLARIATLPPDRIVRDRGEEWTTVKLLRRLAWHERSELRVMRRLLSRARASIARVPEP
jgi:hypothetical protein